MLSNEGVVKVLDLGLAQLQLPPQDSVDQTGDSRIVGTYIYMAPEQLAKDTKADHRADIYSLGVSLLELLAGNETVRRGPLAMKAAIDRELPTPVASLLHRMVAPAPDDRCQSMTEVAEALATLSQKRGHRGPVQSLRRPDWRSWRSRQRHVTGRPNARPQQGGVRVRSARRRGAAAYARPATHALDSHEAHRASRQRPGAGGGRDARHHVVATTRKASSNQRRRCRTPPSGAGIRQCRLFKRTTTSSAIWPKTAACI